MNFQAGPLTTSKDNLKEKALDKQILEKLLSMPKIYTIHKLPIIGLHIL
jgi:hypothetical protein